MTPKFNNKFEFAMAKLITHTHTQEILSRIKENMYPFHNLPWEARAFEGF